MPLNYNVTTCFPLGTLAKVEAQGRGRLGTSEMHLVLGAEGFRAPLVVLPPVLRLHCRQHSISWSQQVSVSQWDSAYLSG